jgi:putative ABC transport system permease protein
MNKSTNIKSPHFNSIIVGINMSFVEMKSHKTRSVLSILGVLLGVASLVTMLTMVGGIDRFLNEKMDKWTGMIWFWQKGIPTEEEALLRSRSPGLKFSDGNYLKENSRHVKEVPQTISRQLPLFLSNESILCELLGMDSASVEGDKDEMILTCGRWFDNHDFSSGTSNCLISWHIAELLQKTYHLNTSLELIGKNINVGNHRLTVIGIFGPINKHQPPRHLMKKLIIPIQTMQKNRTGFDPDPGSIEVQVKDTKNVKQLSKVIALTLREHHRGVEDFEYRTPEWLDKVTSMLTNVSILMTIISCLSLTIGGLSIMNVMLSSISERIREIGIRKALGATNLQIFIQFITETITLSLTGGSLGFVLGLTPLLFKEAILQSTDGSIEPTVLPLHVLFTFVLITGLGVLFGLYPAIRAAKMNPVDALRYE